MGCNAPNYVTSLMLKVIVSFTDTPFLYGTRNIKHDDNWNYIIALIWK